MSVSTEVQRTLVKSPPELWAELGNVDGLTRHLSEIGEIRVVGAEPESRLEWEADQASGIVELKQSGWGTKVTLSLTRELPGVEADVPAEDTRLEAEIEPVAAKQEPELVGEQEPVADVEYESGYATRPETDAEAEVEASSPEPESTACAHEPVTPQRLAAVARATESGAEATQAPIEPKQGFFARLFKRRKPMMIEPERVAQAQPESQPEPAPVIELRAMALPEPIYPDPPPAEPVEPAPALAAELAELEARMQKESTELLTGVLDRLGAAHHRPFSRA